MRRMNEHKHLTVKELREALADDCEVVVGNATCGLLNVGKLRRNDPLIECCGNDTAREANAPHNGPNKRAGRLSLRGGDSTSFGRRHRTAGPRPRELPPLRPLRASVP